MKMLIALAGLWLGMLTVGAADAPRSLADFPAPQAPCVKPVPPKASWTITAQAPPADAKAPATAPTAKTGFASLESMRDGDLKRDLIMYESGKREEVWYFQNLVMVSSSARPGKVVVQSAETLENDSGAQGAFRLLGNPVKSAAYPGFKWVDKRFYTGVVMFNKTTPAYHYLLRGKDGENDITIAEAWVNAETGGPLAYTADGVLYVYRFGDPPTTAAALPPAFEAAYQKLKLAQDRQRRLEADAAALR